MGCFAGTAKKTVTEAAKNFKGVSKASSDFKKGEAKVSFDSSVTDLEAIKKAITDSGYEVIEEGEDCPIPVRSAPVPQQVKTVDHEGGIKKDFEMHCASCALNIETALKKNRRNNIGECKFPA